MTDNLDVNPEDFDPYCITAPADARLPAGGGNRICGLFDIKPTKFGLVNNLQTAASNYGDQAETRHDVDLTLNLCLGNGALLQGGVSAGKSISDNCAVAGKVDRQVVPGPSSVKVLFTPDSAPSTRYCHVETPFLTQVKLLGAFRFPWQLQLSGTLQSIPGDMVSASYVASSAEVRPSLGRNLAAGATANASVNLIEPGTTYLDRINQVDLRLARRFALGNRVRLEANIDAYNLFNVNPVLVANYTYANAATWLAPLTTLQGSLIKFGVPAALLNVSNVRTSDRLRFLLGVAEAGFFPA